MLSNADWNHTHYYLFYFKTEQGIFERSATNENALSGGAIISMVKLTYCRNFHYEENLQNNKKYEGIFSIIKCVRQQFIVRKILAN